ncbi:MAG: hypothetical protein ACK5IJ_01795 [Mangrovibacterium sp.]
MKKFNVLNESKFEKIDRKQMKATKGGGLMGALAVMGAVVYVYNNWDDFVSGVKDGWNS